MKHAPSGRCNPADWGCPCFEWKSTHFTALPRAKSTGYRAAFRSIFRATARDVDPADRHELEQQDHHIRRLVERSQRAEVARKDDAEQSRECLVTRPRKPGLRRRRPEPVVALRDHACPDVRGLPVHIGRDGQLGRQHRWVEAVEVAHLPMAPEALRLEVLQRNPPRGWFTNRTRARTTPAAYAAICSQSTSCYEA